MDKLNLELSPYDVGMLFGALVLARRHGDTQTYDWAGELRDRVKDMLESPEALEETNAILDDSDTMKEAEAYKLDPKVEKSSRTVRKS